jgi:hypothetical protein
MPDGKTIVTLAREAVQSLGLPYDVLVVAFAARHGKDAFVVTFKDPSKGIQSLLFGYAADSSPDEAREKLRRLFKTYHAGGESS